MQPYPNIPVDQRAQFPSSPPSALDSFVERWWVAIPKVLRRYSVLLSETWSDGIYLTIWPLVSILAPLLVVLIGLAEGITHWNLLINNSISSGQLATAFTELLPLMIFAALVGAISANLGLMLVLGYGLGDLLIFGSVSANLSQLGLPTDPLQAFIYLRVPQLVSYALFFMLAVLPTLSTKYLLVRLAPLFKATEPTATILRISAMAIIQGGIVYVWAQAAPLLIRVFWGWTSFPPPLAAAAYLQELGGWVIGAAVLGAVGRGLLAYRANVDQLVTQRMSRLAAALREADMRLAFSRRLPGIVRCMLAALILTLLVSGFIASLWEGALIFLFVSLIFIARSELLPRLSIWVRWVALVTRVPLLLRLIGGAVIAYILTLGILNLYTTLFPAVYSDTPSGSLRPVLVSMCLSLLILTLLLPRVSPARPTTPAQPMATRPF